MVDSMVNWFTTSLDGLPKELIVFIISMIPILELRGGLVVASLFNIDMIKAVIKNFDSKSGVSSRLSFCPIGHNSSIFKTMIGNGKF